MERHSTLATKVDASRRAHKYKYWEIMKPLRDKNEGEYRRRREDTSVQKVAVGETFYELGLGSG